MAKFCQWRDAEKRQLQLEQTEFEMASYFREMFRAFNDNVSVHAFNFPFAIYHPGHPIPAENGHTLPACLVCLMFDCDSVRYHIVPPELQNSKWELSPGASAHKGEFRSWSAPPPSV